MMGIHDQVDANGQDLKGIIPKSVQHIFGFIDGDHNNGKKFLVRCAYLEIYNEKILDLLVQSDGKSKKKGAKEEKSLQIKEDPEKGIYVQDLT